VVTDRQRGQLLLTGAVVIAVVVLASVVVLNAVHSSPSIGAEVDASSLEAVEEADREIRANLERLFWTTAATGTDDNRLPYVDAVAFDSEVGAYEAEYNRLAGAERGLVAGVTYRPSAAQSGVVAYNRSLAAEGDSTRTLIDSAGGPLVGGTDTFTAVSLTAAGVDLGDEHGVVLTFDGPADAEDRLEITDGVRFDSSDPGRSVECGFDDGPATVSVDLRAGTGTVERNGTDTCGVDIEFGDSYGSVELAVDGEGVSELSYVVAAADEHAVCADSRKCVDDSTVDGGIDLNPSFDISLVDPSVTHRSSFALVSPEAGPEAAVGCAWVEDETDGGTDDITVDRVTDCDVVTDGDIDIEDGGTVLGEVTSNEGGVDIDDGTVEEGVTAAGDIDVDDGTVRGDVTAEEEGDIDLDGSTVLGELVAPEGANVDSSVVQGQVTAEDDIDIDDSTVYGPVTATEDEVDVDNSTVEGDIEGEEDVDIDESTIEGDIDSGEAVGIDESTIEGDVEGQEDVDIDESTIEGDVEGGEGEEGVDIDETTVAGDVAGAGDVTIDETAIAGDVYVGGTFHCTASTVGGLDCSQYMPSDYGDYNP